MAETGHPLLELFPPGGTIAYDCAFPNVQILPVSKNSSELSKAPLQPEVLQKHSSKAPLSEKVWEDSGHIKANATMHTTGCAVLAGCSAARPHSIAEVHIPEGAGTPRGDDMTHPKEQSFGAHVSSLCGDLGERYLAPAKLPVQRSLSDSLQLKKDPPAPALCCETSGAGACNQPLACKQGMQLQQRSTTATFCQDGDAPTQQGCPCTAGSASPAAAELSGEVEHSRLEEAVCCSSYPHVAIEGTFAAYCHPQPAPISSPAQPPLQKTAPEGGFKGLGGGPTLLALPPLVTSVSETGLDGKRLLHCCNLECDWPGPLRRVGGQQQAGDKVGAARDVATMTSCTELRDAGVQVGQENPERPAQHVFPEVCLAEEGPAARRKSPVREVKWDTEGMTWEVYGASVDPEELGLAIQKHLELQIKETAGIAAKLSRQSTIASRTSAGKGRHRRKSLLAALRPPGCCTRSTTTVD